MSELFKKSLSKENPLWLMRQAGRYLPEYQKVRKKQKNFINFCLDVNAATKVTLQPIQRYDLDAAIIFSDILVIPYALGQQVDSQQQTEYKDNSYEMITAVGMLCNSDRKRTGDYIKSLREEYVKERDDYPKTVEKAQQCMQTYADAKIQIGIAMYQKNEEKYKKYQGTGKRSCYCCGKKDHVSPDCPDKLKPKEEWKNKVNSEIIPEVGRIFTKTASS